ncbi:MAG: hypothetical protein Kilf2KO_16540 [Rhodospirillales bacterium]
MACGLRGAGLVARPENQIAQIAGEGRRKIFYLYPELVADEQYCDDFYRTIFYLRPLLGPEDRILVPSNRSDSPYSHAPAAFLDANVAEMAQSLRHLVEVLPLPQANARFETFDGQQIICLWDDSRRETDPFLKRHNGHGILVRSDHRRLKHASSHLLRVSSLDGRGTAEQRSRGKRRLRRLLRELRSDRVLLFGTGPSLEDLDVASLPPGTPIATNSMVKNVPLMEALRPKVIVAADPIFHAGASNYAQEFRSLLVDAMRCFESSFVFPMRDVAIYESLLPEDVHERLIGVLTKPDGVIDFDLYETCCISSTRNVMTHFLLPLAANLAPETILVGFDGRPVGDNHYFWNHAGSSQITERMPDIQEANPAFFRIDYDEYYREHCNRVEAYLEAMEARGQQVVSLGRSYVPAVQGRFVDPELVSCGALLPKRPEVSVILAVTGSLGQLKQAVYSLKAQSLDEWELLCVGATDLACRQWLEQAAGQDRRLRVLDCDGACLATALNRGLDAALGRYVSFLDGRDQLLEGALVRRWDFLRNSSSFQVCGGLVELVDGDGRSLGLTRGRGVTARLRHARSSLFHLDSLFGVAHVMKRFRFDPERLHAETWSYLLQILQFGYDIGSCGGKPLALARQESGAQSFGDPGARYAAAAWLLDSLLSQPPTPLFVGGVPIMLSDLQVKRTKARCLQSLFVGVVLLGDREGEDRVLKAMQGLEQIPFLQPVGSDFFEPLAAQALLEPLGSDALHQKINARYQEIFAACERLRSLTAQKDFAITFCCFAMLVARAEAKRGGPKARFGEAERRAWQQAQGLKIKNRARNARVTASGVWRVVRDDTKRRAHCGMEMQRNLRRRIRRWRKKRREAKVAP